MKRTILSAIFLLFLFTFGLGAAPDSGPQSWTNYVHIGAYGLKGGDALQIVRSALASGVFGI